MSDTVNPVDVEIDEAIAKNQAEIERKNAEGAKRAAIIHKNAIEHESRQSDAEDSFIQELADVFRADVETAGEFQTDRGNFVASSIIWGICNSANSGINKSDNLITENVAELRKSQRTEGTGEVSDNQIRGKLKFINQLKLQKSFYISRLVAAKLVFLEVNDREWMPYQAKPENRSSKGRIIQTATQQELAELMSEYPEAVSTAEKYDAQSKFDDSQV